MISIIVPVYNAEKYIRSCIESILAQTFTDFELILVDDGSPDNCPAICDEYAEKDSRIKVIHQENGGVSSARNVGLNTATGQYIMFCDSDDYVFGDWVADMYFGISRYPEALLVANVEYGVDRNVCAADAPIAVDVEFKQCSYYTLYKTGLSAYVVNKIFKRDIIMNNNIRFDESVGFSEDVQFTCEYLRHCKEIRLLDKKLYYYRDNPNGAMRKIRHDLFELHLMPFRVRLPFVAECDMEDYCDTWLFHFLQLFDNVWKPNVGIPTCRRFQYNQKMIKAEEFQFCLHHASGKNENPWVIRILKTKNYYLYWLFDRLAKLKRKLRGEKK